MGEVMGERFLRPLDTMLPMLYSGGTQESDLAEITTFTHHLVRQYQQKAQPLLQKWWYLWFFRIYDIWKGMPQDSEEMKRQKWELASRLLELLKDCSQHCPIVLLEPL